MLDCMQINIFLSRLCGEPIGFTVLGIFVIDKNTVLTVGDEPFINVHVLFFYTFGKYYVD